MSIFKGFLLFDLPEEVIRLSSHVQELPYIPPTQNHINISETFSPKPPASPCNTPLCIPYAFAALHIGAVHNELDSDALCSCFVLHWLTRLCFFFCFKMFLKKKQTSNSTFSLPNLLQLCSLGKTIGDWICYTCPSQPY